MLNAFVYFEFWNSHEKRKKEKLRKERKEQRKQMKSDKILKGGSGLDPNNGLGMEEVRGEQSDDDDDNYGSSEISDEHRKLIRAGMGLSMDTSLFTESNNSFETVSANGAVGNKRKRQEKQEKEKETTGWSSSDGESEEEDEEGKY